MKPEEINDFTHLLTATHDLYGKRLPPESSVLWWELMSPFELADVKQAFLKHIGHPDAGKFLPRPADIIGILKKDDLPDFMRAAL